MTHRRIYPRLLSLCALTPLLLVACGGGGTGTASYIAIKASVQTIAYGDSVSIRWGGAGIAAVRPEGTNFVVTASQISGSLTDRPASDTTYQIEARGKDGETRTASVAVHVTPSTHDLWIVGDQSQAGTPQLTEMLQALTTPLVHLSPTWPSEVPVTDVVVVLDSANLTASDQGSVTSFLESGGRVVFVGRSPASLATGNRDDDDISAIGAWFAGGTNLSGGFPADTATVNPGVPMSTTLIAKSFRYIFDVQPVAPSAIKLTQMKSGGRYGAFLYKPLSGGRAGYVGGAGAGTTPDEQIMNGLLFTAVRWAADGA